LNLVQIYRCSRKSKMADGPKTRNAKREAAKEANERSENPALENNQNPREISVIYQFVKCDSCEIKVLYDQTGHDVSYEEINELDLTFVCRSCRSDSKVAALRELMRGLLDDKSNLDNELKAKINKLETKLDKTENELKTTKEKFTKLETKFDQTENELKTTKEKLNRLEKIVENYLPEMQQEENSESVPQKMSYAAKAAAGVTGKATNCKLVTADMCSALVTKTIEEIENRKSNVILYNIPEPKTGSKEDMKKHEQKKIGEVMERIDVASEVKSVNFFRLGRKEEAGQRTRPLLVKVRSQAERDVILQKAYRCRDFLMEENGRQVAISPDRTKEEREERKNLVTQLQQRIDNGEKDLVLRNGRIIQKKFQQTPPV